MKNKRNVLILLLILLVLAAGGLIYTRPLSFSQICDDIDITDIESFRVSYHIYPDCEEPVQYEIKSDDPRFLLVTNLIAKQKYSKSIWNMLPQTTKMHPLQDGDFKWELGCVVSDVVMKNGEVISGTVIRISDFYGKLEVMCEDRIWRCTTTNQEQWISEMMDTIIMK